MSIRFKSNNLIASLIAVILIAVGVTLSIINKQSQTSPPASVAPATEGALTPEPPDAQPSGDDDTLARVAKIHEGIGAPPVSTREKTELEVIRESIDWSDAPSPAPELVKTDDYDVYINVTKEYLVYVFDKLGYTGEKVDSGETTAVPPLLVVSINKGWAEGETVQFKKSTFYRVILSLVLYENEAVLRERAKLLAILDARKNTGTLTNAQSSDLNQLAHSYRVIEEETEEPVSEEQIAELLKRVDTIPPSLALAQAAHESGYATSRFAHTGNALFGQWDWSKDAIKPEQQREGMGNYGIKAFNQPIDSVRAYIWNLNTHRAYEGFRKERALQRGETPGRIAFDGSKLAGTLTSYSERGAEYTRELQGTISYNRLGRADHLRLMEGEPIYFD